MSWKLEKLPKIEMVKAVKRKAASFAELKRAEARTRKKDFERIRRGEATPEQIQKENSIFSPEEVRSFRITNLPQVIEAICKRGIPL